MREFQAHDSEWVDPEEPAFERTETEIKNDLRETHEQILLETGLADRAFAHVIRYRSSYPPAEACRYDVEVHVGGENHPYDEAINIRVQWEGGSGVGGEDLTVWRIGDMLRPYQEGGLADYETLLLGILAEEVKLGAEEPVDGIYSLANKAHD